MCHQKILKTRDMWRRKKQKKRTKKVDNNCPKLSFQKTEHFHGFTSLDDQENPDLRMFEENEADYGKPGRSRKEHKFPNNVIEGRILKTKHYPINYVLNGNKPWRLNNIEEYFIKDYQQY